MTDEGIRARESVEKQLELRLKRTYTEAQNDILKKLDEFTSKYKEKDKKMRERLEKGEITEEKYKRWLSGQVFMGAQWEEKVKDITDMLTDVRKDDLKMIHDRQIDVFATNANYQAYKMEHDIGKNFGFDLYDKDAVKNLISKKPALLPEKIVDPKKHNHWNQGIIANAVTQGIIQGESIPKIAARIANTTANHDLNASTMYARTAMTCAQNSGRMQMLRDSKAMGINVKKKWMSTHDSRTRDSHIRLDGQVQEVEKPFKSAFGNIEYPGDPKAHPGDVYNCRCTLVYVYPEYDDVVEKYETDKSLKTINFQEWKEKKKKKKEEKEEKKDKPVKIKDITDKVLKKATPGIGKVELYDGYVKKSNNLAERETADWLLKNIGGEIKLLKESNVDGVKMPDYLWNGKLWELKSPRSAYGAKSAINQARKQIVTNPGGIIINFNNVDADIKQVLEIADESLSHTKQTVNLMVIKNEKLEFVRRYKK